MARPEVFLIGDSHTGALARGLAFHGVPFAILGSARATWETGIVLPDETTGVQILSPEGPGRVRQAQKVLGVTDLTNPGVPVIASLALGVGLLPLLVGDWPPEPALAEAVPGDLSEAIRVKRYSSGLLRDIVDLKRAAEYAILRKLAANTDVTVVAAPRFGKWRHRYVLESVIRRDLLAMGVRIHDPSLTVTGPPDYGMPEHFIAPDGHHGNEDYGRAVIGGMIEAGLIRRGAAGPEPGPKPGQGTNPLEQRAFPG